MEIFHITVLISIILLYKPVHTFDEIKNKTQAVKYLAAFGYLESEMQYNPLILHKLTNKMFTEALIDFQTYFSIPTTGILDNDTLKAFNYQRCGCIDKFYRVKKNKSKRFVRIPDAWRINDLTYKISSYPTRELNKTQTDFEIKRAFDQWSGVTPLTFTQVQNGPVHINIAFRAHEHGDITPFDGKLGVYAHTLLPSRDNVHFDDSEIWTAGTNKGTNLYEVAAHEFGHMLGLDHSKNKYSAMRPVYPGYIPDITIKNDDIEGIQELYGEKKLIETREKKQFKRQVYNQNNDNKFNNILCENSKIDTIFKTNLGETYVFKNDYFWKWTRLGLENPQPKLIIDEWIGLPNNIDAAFTYKNGQTYFFKGSKYWRFTDTSLDKGFPKEITFGFAGIPNNIDSSMNLNDKIYFFKGEKYWVYDPIIKPPVSNEYPRPLRDWKNVPASIDVAFYANDNTITFVKDDLYYLFNATIFSAPVNNIPTYSKSIRNYWFNCQL
ncbi:matrix metalloproteinase-19-like isoform X1 [Daktulosphaira vitifoliae]|uniref:matrix metalloproteinase-19-like isoform X1 n=2 Tax=Daktulosphaira vitifoliae TaxID=58002 RepID=UPI0021A994B1|nr:matrix metalloproteinase-19-like isoform X1 [Daktulosphaira vitifoliae]